MAYRESAHPRDRLGRWTDVLGRLHSLTRTEVVAGNVPGVEFDPDMTPGISARAGLGPGERPITVGPSAFNGDKISSTLLAHEAGHHLVYSITKGGIPDELAVFGRGRGRAEGWYGKVAGNHSILYSRYPDDPNKQLPEEFIADAYADLLHGRGEFSYVPGYDGPDDPEEREKARREFEANPYTKFLNLVASKARAVGLPDHALYRFERDGAGEYHTVLREATQTQERPQTPEGLAAIGATGPAVGAAAAPARGVAATGAAGGALGVVAADAVWDSAKIVAVLAALRAFFKAKERQDARFLLTTLHHQFPGQPFATIQAVVRREIDYERAFQAKAFARVERDTLAAGRLADPIKRANRIRAILERERRYVAMRAKAMLDRAVAGSERELLKVLSPGGAYWKLNPHVKEHTLDCLFMAGKFWPWAVLDSVHPPLHPGCPCYLLSEKEAKADGHLPRGFKPTSNAGDAIRRAREGIENARRLQESLVEEVRWSLRWPRGSHHGGEFRPSGNITSELRAVFPKGGALPEGMYEGPNYTPEVQALGDAIDGIEAGGLRAEVYFRDSYPPAGGEVKFRIRDETGMAVGEGEFTRQGDESKFERMSIHPNYQDRGFATAFTQRVFAHLRDQGVRKVKVQAIEVGSYAWARAGFVWSFGAEAEQRRMLTEAVERGRWYEMNGKVPKGVLDEFTRKVSAGEFSSEAEMAAFGIDHPYDGPDGRAWWVGKRVMVDGRWPGERKP